MPIPQTELRSIQECLLISNRIVREYNKKKVSLNPVSLFEIQIIYTVEVAHRASLIFFAASLDNLSKPALDGVGGVEAAQAAFPLQGRLSPQLLEAWWSSNSCGSGKC